VSVKSVNLYGSPIPENLDSWSDIETLNLCFSGLKSLDKIAKLKCLKRLYLRHNEIDSFQEIKKLKKISSLSSLSLIGNPICQLENYRREILQILPELSILDGEILDSSESRRTSKSSTKHSINSDETICIPKKPNTVMAISLLLNELENPDDLDEIKKTLKVRLKKIKETTDIFTV